MQNENNEQKLNDQVPKPSPNRIDLKSKILIVLPGSIFLVSLIVGGIYFWQESKIKKSHNLYMEKISILNDRLNNRILELEAEKNLAEQEKDLIERKTCKGEWKNGICVIKTCVDSDINERPDDIYIKGNVVYTDVNGVSNTIYDECTGTKKQVNEMHCYESPKGSGNYVQGREVFDCQNGCFDGACVR